MFKNKSGLFVILSLLATCLISLPVLTGCAQSAPAPAPSKPTPAPAPAPAPQAKADWPKAISIGVASLTGAGGETGMPLAELLTRKLGITSTCEVTGGSYVPFMHKGQIELAVGVGRPLMYWGVTEPSERAGGVSQNARLILEFYTQSVGTMVRRSSNIMTYMDLVGKTVAIFSKTSESVDMGGRFVYEEFGILDKIKAKEQVGEKFGKEGIIEGTIDAWWYPVGGLVTGPAAYVQEPDSAVGLRLLDIGKERSLTIAKKRPMYLAMELPAGYLNQYQKEPIWTIGWNASIIARLNLPEDLVYEVTKLIWADIDQLKARSKLYAECLLPKSIENAVAPVHTGAIRYYREIGVWTAEMEARNKAMLAKIGAKA